METSSPARLLELNYWEAIRDFFPLCYWVVKHIGKVISTDRKPPQNVSSLAVNSRRYDNSSWQGRTPLHLLILNESQYEESLMDVHACRDHKESQRNTTDVTGVKIFPFAAFFFCVFFSALI